ncbi:MAG: hypothetical protein R3F02_06920 [Thiolinea sp.]
MARFRPLDQVQPPDVTSVTSTETGNGYAECNTNPLINKETHNDVTTVTGVTAKKTKAGSETGGGVAVATSDIFRARLQQAAHDLPVEMAVLVAEFANDEQDIVQGNFDDETLRTAVFTFVVYHLGLQPLQDSTPADDGMVRCRQCGHWWNRCRHPDKFRGLWPELHPDRWRRCAQYRQREKY